MKPDLHATETVMHIELPKQVMSACKLGAESERHAESLLPYWVTRSSKRGSSRIPAFTCTLMITLFAGKQRSREWNLLTLKRYGMRDEKAGYPNAKTRHARDGGA